MASQVLICKMALSHIGSEATIVSIDPPDGSVEAGYCETYYDAVRAEMLELGNWAFALAREELAQNATNPSPNWAYSYALPSDCLRPLRVIAQGYSIVFGNEDYEPTDADGAPFEIEGSSLYTNEPLALLVYVVDVTDTAKFTPSFVSAFSYLLASYLAGPIIKGNEGMRVGDAMRQIAMQKAQASATASANGATEVRDFEPASIRARR